MNPLSPNRMSAEERLAEIAEILALGLMRLRQSSAQSAHSRDSSLQLSPAKSVSAPGERRC